MKKLPASYRPLSLAQPAGSARTGRTASSWDEFVAALLDMSGKDLVTLGEFGQSSVGANKVVTITAPFRFEKTVQIDASLSGLTVQFEGYCPIEAPASGVPLFELVEDCLLQLIRPSTAPAPAPQGLLVRASGAHESVVVIDEPILCNVDLSIGGASRLAIRGGSSCSGEILAFSVGPAYPEIHLSGCDMPQVDVNAEATVVLSGARLGDVTIPFGVGPVISGCRLDDLDIAADDGVIAATVCGALTVSGDDNLFSSVKYTGLTDTGTGNLYGP